MSGTPQSPSPVKNVCKTRNISPRTSSWPENNVIVGSTPMQFSQLELTSDKGKFWELCNPPVGCNLTAFFCVKHCRQYVDALYNSTFKPNTHRIELLFNQIETRSAKKSDYMFYLSPCFFLHPLISILQQVPSKRFPVRKLRLKIFRKIWGGLAGLEDTMNMQLCAHSEGSTSLNFLNDACDASHEQNIYGEFYIWSDTSHKQGAFMYDFISWIIELQRLWFIVSWPLQNIQNTQKWLPPNPTKQKSNDTVVFRQWFSINSHIIHFLPISIKAHQPFNWW